MSSNLRRFEHELSVRFTQELGVRVCLSIADDVLAVSELSPGEKAQLAKFRTQARQQIWLRGRQALKRLLAELGQSTCTQHLAFPNATYSISHGAGVSVALGVVPERVPEGDCWAGIGIDVEMEKKIDLRNRRFFLTDNESGCAEQQYLLRLWTAKEAIFKSDPENHRRNFVDYELVDPLSWSGDARLLSEPGCRIRYSSIPWENGMISAAVFNKG
jgi:4'-phosphopantetheinyl transferase EntD